MQLTGQRVFFYKLIYKVEFNIINKIETKHFTLPLNLIVN